MMLMMKNSTPLTSEFDGQLEVVDLIAAHASGTVFISVISKEYLAI